MLPPKRSTTTKETKIQSKLIKTYDRRKNSKTQYGVKWFTEELVLQHGEATCSKNLASCGIDNVAHIVSNFFSFLSLDDPVRA
jgi:hypothetical protein